MGDSVIVRMLGANELTLLGNVADDVFDEAVNPRWAAEFLADPRHHLAVALDGDLIVGFASAVHYTHPDKAPELWINEVGVAPGYQGRGIGKRLMRALLARGRELGCTEAWVLTEQENSAAQALYEAAGGARQTVVYFTFALKNDDA